MADLKEITPANIIIVKNFILSCRLKYGYLATLCLLQEYESKEYYLMCHCILSAVVRVDSGHPSRYGKEALFSAQVDYDRINKGYLFDEHVAALPERTKQLREYVESSWMFVRR